MGPAGALFPVPLQEPAPDVKQGVDQQVARPGPQVTKGDVFGVAQEPGGLVVAGGRALVQGTDAQGNRDAKALGTESAA